MEVKEETSKPSKSEIRIAISTLFLHSMFVDKKHCVEKITKYTRQLSSLLKKILLQGCSQRYAWVAVSGREYCENIQPPLHTSTHCFRVVCF